MFNFNFYTPTRVVFGKETEYRIGKLVKNVNCKKVLLHYGSGSVIRSGLLGRIKESLDASVDFKTMCVLALATSIDALAIGVTLSFLSVDIVPAVSFIGATTFCLSIVGVKAGNVFGTHCKSRAELAGGAILLIIGSKILIEHLFF